MSALQHHPDLIGNRAGGQINLAFAKRGDNYVNLVTGKKVNTASVIKALQLAEKHNAYAEITVKHPKRRTIPYPGHIDNLCRHCDTCLVIISHMGVMHVVDEHGALAPEMNNAREIGLSFGADVLSTTHITAQQDKE